MYLLTWTPVVCSKKGFPKKEDGTPYLPGKLLKEAVESAFIYYYIKKDKEIENKVRTYLLIEALKPEEVVERIKDIIYEKYEVIRQVKFPEEIPLKQEGLRQELVEVFDLERWRDVREYRLEVFKGVVEFDMSLEDLERFKPACHSYAEALVKMERSLLKDHPLVERFYNPLSSKIKNWKLPLRVGMWTEVKYRGNLLFFWRIKDVRERLIRDYGIDIQPKEVLFLPKERVTVGWCELTDDLSQ